MRKQQAFDASTILDMSKLAKQIDNDLPIEQDIYAPKPKKVEQVDAVREVKTFAELQLAQLDTLLSAAEAEMDTIRSDAQRIKSLIVSGVDMLIADIERHRKGCSKVLGTFKQLDEDLKEMNGEITVKSATDGGSL